MPIENGQYVSPGFVNQNPPAIDADELNALCSTVQFNNTITGTDVPNSSTQGSVGQLYYYNGTIYMCTSANNGSYTWSPAFVNAMIPISSGGTGANNAPAARQSLGITYANLGIVPIAQGGTGASSQTAAFANIVGSNAVNVSQGGTGANNKQDAKTNLGISYGSTLPESGEEGDVFFLIT